MMAASSALMGPVLALRARQEVSMLLALALACSWNAAPTAEAICLHVAEYVKRGEISRYAVPDQVYFVDAIPKTSVGKLDKKALRHKYVKQEPATESMPAPGA